MKRTPACNYADKGSISSRGSENIPRLIAQSKLFTLLNGSRRHEPDKDSVCPLALNLPLISIEKHLATLNNGQLCLESIASDVPFESHVLVSLWDSDTKCIRGDE